MEEMKLPDSSNFIPGPPDTSRSALRLETVLVFLRLGCTSFGGPVAHLGYFQNEFVQRRRWLSQAAYADVVALCQFLPGPASSQVALVLGYIRSGLVGGVLGWMAFTAPSTLLMIGFAYGIHFIKVETAGWLLGLKVAAVAVVAQAIWTMAKKLCPDLIRILVMIVCALLLIISHRPWLQPVVIAAAALFGLVCMPTNTSARLSSDILPENSFLSRRWAATSLVLFAVLLGGSFFGNFGGEWGNTFARFYRTGSLVFGGGLISHDVFLAGYGAAQAFPGPLFTFAAFLGASLHSAYPPWMLGLWCLVAILLPSLLLIVGTLPFWAGLSGNVRAQAAMKGANAAVVGLLLAAFCDPIWKNGITSPQTLLIGTFAFALLQFWKVPNWIVVLICALSGEWLL
jgi:chromate transporter